MTRDKRNKMLQTFMFGYKMAGFILTGNLSHIYNTVYLNIQDPAPTLILYLLSSIAKRNIALKIVLLK